MSGSRPRPAPRVTPDPVGGEARVSEPATPGPVTTVAGPPAPGSPRGRRPRPLTTSTPTGTTDHPGPTRRSGVPVTRAGRRATAVRLERLTSRYRPQRTTDPPATLVLRRRRRPLLVSSKISPRVSPTRRCPLGDRTDLLGCGGRSGCDRCTPAGSWFSPGSTASPTGVDPG